MIYVSSFFILTSCSQGEELYISSSSTVYYLDKTVDNDYSLRFSVNDKSILSEHLSDDIQYYIKGENNCKAVMIGDSFTATELGKVVVSAKIGDLESLNEIEITVSLSDYIPKSEDQIANKLEEISTKTIDFGGVVNIGIDAKLANKYHLLGCDDIMFINEKGQLEVCGVMLATEVTLHSDLTNRDIWTGDLSSTFGTIVSSSIKKELVNAGVISKTDTTITKTKISNVKKLNLDGLIANDLTSINGLKWLVNLEELNLSNNGIDNIEFASNAKKLKKLFIKNNHISSLLSLKNHKGLEYLDISENNITDLSYVQNYIKLKYLDLSDNNITDITNVGNLVNLESLYLNNNQLSNFKDALAELNNLKELALGHCGLIFTDIISIQFIDKSNITYLDLSGTSVNINRLMDFTNLSSLILQDANLNNVTDISILNNFTKLECLDISNNQLNLSNLCTQDSNNISFKLNPSSLNNLKTLYLGGNEFSSLPDLSGFDSLCTLDLTNSYNLKSLESLGKLKIKSLILDECNSIQINDNGENYLEAISKDNLPNLEKLSIASGLYYMTKELFDNLSSLVKNGEFELKFIGENYIDKNTIYDYTQSIFFTMEDFLNNATITKTENNMQKTVIDVSTEEVILSLVNDRTSLARNTYYFYIPSQLYKMSIYGNEYETYSMGFNIMDRKQSSITFDFNSFKSHYFGTESAIWAEKGSKININTYNNCEFSSNNYTATFDVWDIKIKTISGELTIKGKNGKNGSYVENHSNDGRASVGETGGNGSSGIKCNYAKILGNVNIFAGNGGNGGDILEGWDDTYGGNGGNGGCAIIYSYDCICDTNVKLYYGIGGKGGNAKTNAWFRTAYNGNSGENGVNTKKIN